MQTSPRAPALASRSESPDATERPPARPVRIWDLPTRVFHWLLAAAFAAQWLTQDDAQLLDFHVFTGYAIGVLLLFRLAWGVVGTQYARFRSFAFGPREGLRHLHAMLAGRHERHLGHNPAGSWSIFGLLALGLASVATGIAALGGAKHLGPLRAWIGYAGGDTLVFLHKYLAWAMLALVAMHLAGVVLASRAERENLAVSMIVGSKRSAETFEGVPAAAPVAFVLLLLLAVGAWAYFRGYVEARPDAPYLPYTLPALVQSAAWDKECSGCHLAYHPSILPARSWNALLRGQREHFGEDLDLDDETSRTLRDHALAHPAESHATPLAWKIDSTTAADTVLLRVTEAGYWKDRHAGLNDADWRSTKPFACDGCHLDAMAGTYLPGAIRVGTPATPAGKAR